MNLLVVINESEVKRYLDHQLYEEGPCCTELSTSWGRPRPFKFGDTIYFAVANCERMFTVQYAAAIVEMIDVDPTRVEFLREEMPLQIWWLGLRKTDTFEAITIGSRRQWYYAALVPTFEQCEQNARMLWEYQRYLITDQEEFRATQPQRDAEEDQRVDLRRERRGVSEAQTPRGRSYGQRIRGDESPLPG